MKNNQNPTSLHWADGLLFIVALLAVKFRLSEIAPISFNALRYLVTALVLVAVVYSSGQTLRIQRKHLLYVALVGVLGNTGYPLLFVYGVDGTSADNAALIMASMSVWVALLSTGIQMEKLTIQGRKKWFSLSYNSSLA